MRMEVPFNYAKTTEFGQIRFLDSFEKKIKPVSFSSFFLYSVSLFSSWLRKDQGIQENALEKPKAFQSKKLIINDGRSL